MATYFRLTLICMLAVPSASVNAQGQTGADFKRVLLADWRALRGTITNARWETKIEYFRLSDTGQPVLRSDDTTRRVVSSTGGWIAFTESRHLDEYKKTTKRSDHFMIANSKYTADLAKPKKGEGWFVTRTVNTPADADTVLPLPCPWMVVGNRPLPQWFEEDGFEFTRVEHHDAATIRAHFTFSPLRPGSGNTKGGFIDFDPSNHYRPLRYRYELKNSEMEGMMRGELEYQDGRGIPILTGTKDDHEFREKGKPSLKVKEITTITNLEYNTNVEDEEFRLTFYGIPEPTGVVWPKKSSTWYLWFIAAGLIFIGVGWYLRNRLQKRHANPAPNSST